MTRLRRAVAALAAAATVAPAPGASAFDFVEHAQLTVDAARGLPEPARVALRGAIAEARKGSPAAGAGLPLCDDPLASLETGVVRACVPYGALPSLAADHHATEGRLIAGLADAGALVSGAASSLRKLEANLAGIPRGDAAATAQARADALRAHDLFQTVQHGWFSEDGYVELASRGLSHFHAADEPIASQLEDLVHDGRVDRALAQAIVHHLRSLQLASSYRRTGRRWELARALAAHAFAMHFAQDAHSAGHAVTTAPQFTDPDGRMRRHDYFGFRGVGLTFALADGPCAARAVETFAPRGPVSPCWAALGDGNLGEPGAIDREHAAASTRALQLQLAMALEPSIAARWSEEAACPEGEVGGEPVALCAAPPPGLAIAAELLDPNPPWSLPAGFAPPRGAAGCARAAAIVAAAQRAITQLDGPHRIPAVTSDAPDDRSGVLPVRGVVTADEIGAPLDRCALPSPRVRGAPVDPAVDELCRAGGVARAHIGTPGASLLRPLLARWPVPQAQATTLTGEAGNGRGWGWQMELGMQVAHTPEAESQLFLFAAFGVAPRFQDIFPQESSFAPVALNAGFGPSFLLPQGDGSAAAFVELRVPLLSVVPAALLDLATDEVAPAFLTEITWVPHGARLAYDLERAAIRWDVELLSAHVPLGSTFLPHRADLLPAELRLRVGRDHGLDAWTVGLELVSGVTGMFENLRL